MDMAGTTFGEIAPSPLEPESPSFSQLMDSRKAPTDSYGLVYIIFCFLGAGMLWPYNTLVSVPEYFTLLYPNASLEFTIPMILNYPALLLLVVLVRYGNLISFKARIASSFLVFALSILALPLIHSLSLFDGHNFKLIFTISAIFLAGVFTAVLQSSLLGLVSSFPQIYTQAVMGGNGIAGFVVILLRIGTKLAYKDGVDGVIQSANVYFYISAAFSILCLCLYFSLQTLPFARYYLNNQTDAVQEEETHLIQPEIIIDGEHRDESSQKGRQKMSYCRVLRLVWKNGFAVLSVFLLTFMIFPGLTTHLYSSTWGISKTWFVLLLFLEFNFFDLIGRLLPSKLIIFGPDKLWIASSCRFILYPMFILCIHPKVFVNDLWAVVLMAIFALSNGYIASLGMMYGPGFVDSLEEKETAGLLMSCFLTFGIFAGSHVALLANTLGIGIN